MALAYPTATSGHLSERVRKNQFPCDECGRAYSAKKNLERHVQQHHMKEKCHSGLFSCFFFEGCQHAGNFRRATDLVSHCEKNHSGLLSGTKLNRQTESTSRFFSVKIFSVSFELKKALHVFDLVSFHAITLVSLIKVFLFEN